MTDKAKRCIEALRVRCRERDSCDGCAKDDYCRYHGNEALHDFAAYLLETLSAELEQVKRERDAAVEDIPRECHKCKHFKVLFNGCTPDYDCEYSDVCGDGDRWQWRGVKEGC